MYRPPFRDILAAPAQWGSFGSPIRSQAVLSIAHARRYGIQLGTKVPLWGGFTGTGKFTFRQWTPHPKMTKSDWAERVVAVKRALDTPVERVRRVRPKIWHDNEKFLIQPDVYI